eukprot:Gb_31392 [translate_table: standard]
MKMRSNNGRHPPIFLIWLCFEAAPKISQLAIFTIVSTFAEKFGVLDVLKPGWATFMIFINRDGKYVDAWFLSAFHLDGALKELSMPGACKVRFHCSTDLVLLWFRGMNGCAGVANFSRRVFKESSTKPVVWLSFLQSGEYNSSLEKGLSVNESSFPNSCVKMFGALVLLPNQGKHQLSTEFLSNELDCGGDDASMAAGPQYQTSCQQHNHSSVLNCQPGALGQVIAGEGARLRQSEQSKNNVLPNSLSSPVRRSLQTFQMAQGGYVSVNNVPQVASGERRFGFAMGPDHGSFHGGQVSSASQHAGLNSVASIPCHIGVPTRMYQEQPQQNRDANVYNENDSSMDMHADSPAGGFYQ